jgi:hypothetical protein
VRPRDLYKHEVVHGLEPCVEHHTVHDIVQHELQPVPHNHGGALGDGIGSEVASTSASHTGLYLYCREGRRQCSMNIMSARPRRAG